MSNFIFLIGISVSEVEILLGLAIILSVILFFILIITRIFIKFSFKKMLFLAMAIPIITLTLLCFVRSVFVFFNSPMTVKKYHLQGEYVINRKMFKGKNADWQYKHYRMSIYKDTMYLHILNHGKEIKRYKKKIKYLYPYHRGHSVRDHTFLAFDDKPIYVPDYQNKEEMKMYHLLNKDPMLMANPFSFNIILVSEKYGNMFFTHGKWKEIEE